MKKLSEYAWSKGCRPRVIHSNAGSKKPDHHSRLEKAHAHNFHRELQLNVTMTSKKTLFDLPREIRDQIYDYVIEAHPRNICYPSYAVRVEFEHLRYFIGTPASICIVLFYQQFLVNRQFARECVERLFQTQRIRFVCGPKLLHVMLERILLSRYCLHPDDYCCSEYPTDVLRLPSELQSLEANLSYEPDSNLLSLLKDIEVDWPIIKSGMHTESQVSRITYNEIDPLMEFIGDHMIGMRQGRLIVPLPFGKVNNYTYRCHENYWIAFAASAIRAVLKGYIGTVVVRLTPADAFNASPSLFNSWATPTAYTDLSPLEAHLHTLVEEMYCAVGGGVFATQLHLILKEKVLVVDRDENSRPYNSVGQELEIHLTLRGRG